MSSHDGRAERAGTREWVGLAVLALPTLLVSLDLFVMLMALPQLSRALHASGVQQLWIMDGYRASPRWPPPGPPARSC